MTSSEPLQQFIRQFDALLDRTSTEALIIKEGSVLLADLVKQDNWLSAPYRQPHPEYYQQYLLHMDERERFSVVSFVWGPGQSTPIHNHSIWGLIGVLSGAEDAQSYVLSPQGMPVAEGVQHRLMPGQVDAVSPTIGDVHRVSNAYDDRVSVSIHVYGANIGKTERAVFTEDGQRKLFISGYASPDLSIQSD